MHSDVYVNRKLGRSDDRRICTYIVCIVIITYMALQLTNTILSTSICYCCRTTTATDATAAALNTVW